MVLGPSTVNKNRWTSKIFGCARVSPSPRGAPMPESVHTAAIRACHVLVFDVNSRLRLQCLLMSPVIASQVCGHESMRMISTRKSASDIMVYDGDRDRGVECIAIVFKS
jgi:hypothetical protein